MEEIQDVVVPIYSCPSKRPPTRVIGGNGWPEVLMDYAGIYPITTYYTDEHEPVNPATLTRAGDVADYFFKFNPHPNSQLDTDCDMSAPCQQEYGAYDGVIVRSPWYRHFAQNLRVPGIEGQYLTGVPGPTTMAKITDGSSKTAVIGEKYVPSNWYSTGSSSDDTGWMDGWDPDVMRSTGVPPMPDSEWGDGLLAPSPGTSPPGPPWWVFALGSPHPGGFNVVFADGSVHTVNYGVDIYVLNSLGTRNGTSYKETSSMQDVN